jgi:hypothetical protein
MRALLIDEITRKKIADVIRYAEENVYSMDDLLDMINGQLRPPGDDVFRVIVIPIGYRTVYSLEDQASGMCRHISISVPNSGKLPSIPAVQMIIKEFGFKNDLVIPSDINVPIKIDVEELGDNHQAISIIEKINDHG